MVLLFSFLVLSKASHLARDCDAWSSVRLKFCEGGGGGAGVVTPSVPPLQ